MAENKKSVLIYCDLIHTVQHLPDDLAGKLFKHFLAYVNDQDPQTDDVMLKIAFEPIKQQLKRDLKKYEEKKGNNSIAGVEGNLKRWHPDLYEQYKKGEINIEQATLLAKGRKTSQPDKPDRPPIKNIANIAVTVNDTDTVIDNDNVTGNAKGKKDNKRTNKKFVQPTKDELAKFFKEKGLTELRAKEKAEDFINHYDSNNWKVGRNKMASWQGAAGGIWMKSEKNSQTINNNPLQLGEQDYTAHEQ